MKYKPHQAVRHHEANEQYEMYYGIDNLYGLFIEVHDADDMLVSLTEVEDKLTPQRLAEIADEYGFNVDIGEETIV